MPDSQDQRVTCPSCSKGYRWQERLVGRPVDCKKCGERFEVPPSAGMGISLSAAPADDGLYDLAVDDTGHTAADPEPKAAPAVGGKCPACNSKVAETAVLCLNCGFNMKDGTRVQTAVVAVGPATDLATPAGTPDAKETVDRATKRDDYDAQVAADAERQHRFEEFTFPLIVMGVGVMFALLNGLVLAPQFDRAVLAPRGMDIGFALSAAQYFTFFAITITFMFPILLGGIFFMAAVLGSAFGNLFTALLKLAALVMLIVAFDNSMSLGLDILLEGFGGIGWMIRIAFLVCIFYPLCGKLFDMEGFEIGIMMMIYLIAPMAVGLLVVMLFSGFF